MIRKAQLGHATSGPIFGYRNVPLLNADGAKSHFVRQINEAEATVVKKIFVLAAQGKGAKRIARALNAMQLPCQKPQRGCPGGWNAGTVRSVLFRPTYKGLVIYGKSKKRRDESLSRRGLLQSIFGLILPDDKIGIGQESRGSQRFSDLREENQSSPVGDATLVCAFACRSTVFDGDFTVVCAFVCKSKRF
jgi:hypothetical protein